MRRAPLHRALACFFGVVASAAAMADDHDDTDRDLVRHDEDVSVTPYRPSVANPAVLPVPGWLEFELGGLTVHDEDGSRTDTVPWLIKYAFTENSGILFGGDAFDRLRAPGFRRSGFGDTYLEWKQRFPAREGLAFGLETGWQFPTAPAPLGIGKPAFILNGIASIDIGDSELDINLGGQRFTSVPPGGAAWQRQWAFQLSQPLNDTFGVTLELSGDAQPNVEHSHQALAAINYNASRRAVFDCGVAYGLDRSAHDHHLFCGGAFLLGRLR